MIVTPGHFTAHPADAAALFKATVTTIEIEISSYCNRRCGFCPNSSIDRISGQTLMDDALFDSVLGQLGRLDWEGVLSFHRYNEPLSDRDYFMRRLHEARRLAPSAHVRVFTNGDYLTRDYLDAIYEGGCRSIISSVYLQEGKPYDDEAMEKAVVRRIANLGLTFTWDAKAPGFHWARVPYKDMEFIVRGQDYFRTVGEQQALFNRGGILPVNTTIRRTDPCTKPFVEMQIEVDGTLLPCCEFRSDHPDHQAYVLGRLQPGDDIVAAWTSASYAKWRRDLFSFDAKTGACATCTLAGIGDTPEIRTLVANVRQHWIEPSEPAVEHSAACA